MRLMIAPAAWWKFCFWRSAALWKSQNFNRQLGKTTGASVPENYFFAGYSDSNFTVAIDMIKAFDELLLKAQRTVEIRTEMNS